MFTGFKDVVFMLTATLCSIRAPLPPVVIVIGFVSDVIGPTEEIANVPKTLDATEVTYRDVKSIDSAPPENCRKFVELPTKKDCDVRYAE
jgi:xanthosine utilization system XapX-like protein